ncbi:MAG TPA: agmatinase [Elusimicrobia bacterium]|nr:agmatinase [Elusimicrobiota bacterium]HBT61843.1 agmatinase [Elusimicrobiota bacterium]
MRFPLSALQPAGETRAGHFMGVAAPLKKARFVVLPLAYERTTSHKKGTCRGPAALLEGSLGVELFDEELGRQTYSGGIHTLRPPRLAGPAHRVFARIAATVARIAAMPDKTLFCLGGEHSLSHATIPPFLRRYPDLGVLHFDAHADMRPEYEGSPLNHACAMYPISRQCPIVQVGIRSVAEEEAHLLNRGRVSTFLWHEHRDMRRLIPQVLRRLPPTVYLSIDLDGFDPAAMPGVGTPQPGGYLWHEALALFKAVIASKKVVGAEIMELCPLQDTVSSEVAAAKLIYRLMGYLQA